MLCSGLYQALLDEGRGLLGEEAAKVDALLEETDGHGGGSSVDEDAVMAAILADPLLQYQKTITGTLLEENSESVMSNKTGFQATFLSTLTSQNGIKTATSLALRTLQAVWLFDCGEDTQRSLIGHTLVDWKRIERIFIGSMDPEAVLGLPGMLCTISASRSKGHEAADIPVHVYGPPGLVSFVSSMLAVSRTYLEMPVIIHEFTPGPVPSESLWQPVEVLKRSRLYAMKLPPDQLNPEGYYDGELSPMLSRHTKKRSGGGSDLRSGTLPQQLPKPGNPNMGDKLSIADMTWTVRADHEWVITASALKYDKPCLGFKAIESDRSGRLYPDIAQALGVFDSNKYSDLKAGIAVTNEMGEQVYPDQCVGPRRIGRTIGIIPPCTDSLTFAKKLGPIDLLIHSVTSKGPQGIRSIAVLAGACAKLVNAKELVLWQPLTSFLDFSMSNDDEYPVRILKEAKDAFAPSDCVTIGGSFAAHQWDREDGDRLPLDVPDDLRHLLDKYEVGK